MPAVVGAAAGPPPVAPAGAVVAPPVAVADLTVLPPAALAGAAAAVVPPAAGVGLTVLPPTALAGAGIEAFTGPSLVTTVGQVGSMHGGFPGFQPTRGLTSTSGVPSQLAVVRLCSCIVPVSFTLYLCSVAVHSWLNWFAVVIIDCSCNALQLIRVHYEIEVYSGIRTSICPPVVMYAEFLGSSLA